MKAKTAPIDSARSRTEFDRATVACDIARAHQKIPVGTVRRERGGQVKSPQASRIARVRAALASTRRAYYRACERYDRARASYDRARASYTRANAELASSSAELASTGAAYACAGRAYDRTRKSI